MTDRMRNGLVTGLLLAGSLVLALVVAEIALRVIGYTNPVLWTYDDITGSRLYAGAEGWFRSEGESYVKINSDGLRDREHARTKPPNTLRIAVLGDSMTEALQVPQEASYPSVLERQLRSCKALAGRDVEVINFGVSGYGTAQALLTYRRRAAVYAPDVTVLGFYAGNDVRNNSRQLEPNKLRPFFRERKDGKLELDASFLNDPEYVSYKATFDRRRILFESRVFQLVRQFTAIAKRWTAPATDTVIHANLEPGSDDKIFLPPTSAAWVDAWNITERLIEAMRGEVVSAGGRFVLVSIPIGIQVYPDAVMRREFAQKIGAADLWYPDRRIREFADRTKVEAMTLGERFHALAEKHGSYLYGFKNTRLGTGHLNENGHKLIGEALAERLCPSGSSTSSPSG
jgi:lysophospholipase L1-like esterase